MRKIFDVWEIKTAWALLITLALLIIVWMLTKNQHPDFANYLYLPALFLFVSAWIITLKDIRNNTVYNKVFWTASMFVLPYLTIFVYLIRRNKLIWYGQKHGIGV